MARTKLPKLTAVDLCLAAGLPILAYSEWLFGTKVLGLPDVALPIAGGLTIGLALFVPAFLDSYVVTAMRRGGPDVGWALALVLCSVVGGSVAHLYDLPKELKVVASGVFGLVVGIVIWRVKKMQHSDSPEAVAVRAATADLERVSAELAAARTEAAAARAAEAAARGDLAVRDEQLATAAAEHAADRHSLEIEIARLGAQLDTVRTAPVVPLRRARPDTPPETRPAGDDELLAVIRPLVTNGAGRPTIEADLRGRGLACGSERLRTLIARAKDTGPAAGPAQVTQPASGGGDGASSAADLRDLDEDLEVVSS